MRLCLSLLQDKKEEKGSALLGLTLRGMQVYQVGVYEVFYETWFTSF